MCSRLLVFVLFLLGSAMELSARDDWGGDHALALKVSLNERWALHSKSKVVTRDDMSELSGGYIGAGLAYQLTDAWNVRAGYRHVWSDAGDHWREERRPYAEAAYRFMWGDFVLKNRGRFELRLYDFDRDDEVRFRNKFMVEAPYRLTRFEFQPFISDELFYNVENERIDANRLESGVYFRPMDGLKFMLGYRWVHFRSGNEFINGNVLISSVSMTF